MTGQTERYLSVGEAAALLRTTAQTVYRWCRSGRLKAVKIGKEWRIPAGQLGGQPGFSGVLPLEQLLTGLVGRAEHLLGLAGSQAALVQMEASFFEVAMAAGGHLVHIRWTEAPEDVRRRLRPVLGSRAAGRTGLRVLDFAGAYERHGVAGPRRLLGGEIERAKARGRFCYAYGSCYDYFGYHHDRLASFQREIASDLGGQPLLFLCGLVIDELYEATPVSVLLDLGACHTGTIVFDGHRALLQRPA